MANFKLQFFSPHSFYDISLEYIIVQLNNFTQADKHRTHSSDLSDNRFPVQKENYFTSNRAPILCFSRYS